MFKFIHSADIHLDSQMEGLQRYDGAPVDEIRGATRRALENLVSLAIKESVSFVLICGDVYDSGWKDANTGLFFVGQMARLQQCGIPVFMISGNHDSASQITKALKLPDNVKTFPHTKPQTHLISGIQVAIHGQSFAEREVTTDLSADYPVGIPDYFNIGLLHTSIDGRIGHATYAPCSLTTLRSKGYGYWALGHVHSHEVLSEEPHIVFPGNIQGRNIRERGMKGCSLVAVDDCRVLTVDHVPLDVVRWWLCSVSASGYATAEEVLDAADQALASELSRQDDRILAARVEVVGESLAHSELASNSQHWRDELRSRTLVSGSGRIWIEKLKIKTSPLGTGESVKLQGKFNDIFDFVRSVPYDDDALAALASEFTTFKQWLPVELSLAGEPFIPDKPEFLRGLMPEIEEIIASRLRG